MLVLIGLFRCLPGNDLPFAVTFQKRARIQVVCGLCFAILGGSCDQLKRDDGGSAVLVYPNVFRGIGSLRIFCCRRILFREVMSNVVFATAATGRAGVNEIFRPEPFVHRDVVMRCALEKIFQQLGCNTCHRSDSQARGPNLAGLYGNPVKLKDGSTVIADEGYIRESVVNPNTKIVAGFDSVMPTFQGQINEDDMLALVYYIKSLHSQEPGGPVKTSPNSTEVPGANPPVKLQ